MGLRNTIPFTEIVLAKLTELEPMFTMSSGAASELFGFNDLRKMKRWERYRREKAKGKAGKYRLTPKGWLKFALNYAQQFKSLPISKIKQDGYILIFDIPEKYRHFRDTLRNVLYSLGFSQLQKSVFFTQDKKAFEFAGRIVVNCELEDRVKFVIAEKVF
ncbi:MAG: hypothetical protein AB1352_04380 [Patescibacteria group bacterium]